MRPIAAAPRVGIKRIPIGLTKPRQRRPRPRAVAASGIQHHRPMGGDKDRPGRVFARGARRGKTLAPCVGGARHAPKRSPGGGKRKPAREGCGVRRLAAALESGGKLPHSKTISRRQNNLASRAFLLHHRFEMRRTWFMAICCWLALGRADAQPGAEVFTARSASGQFLAVAPRRRAASPFAAVGSVRTDSSSIPPSSRTAIPNSPSTLPCW